jgi:hypothetical protein
VSQFRLNLAFFNTPSIQKGCGDIFAKQMPELSQYEADVNALKLSSLNPKNPSTVVGNRGADHARIVLKVLFEYAQKTVLIYSHCLSGDSYDLITIKNFLKQEGTKLKIVLDCPLELLEDNGSIIPYLKEFVGKNLFLYVLQQSYKTTDHYAIFDYSDIRKEKNHPKREADVYFSDYLLARSQADEFEKLILTAQPIASI